MGTWLGESPLWLVQRPNNKVTKLLESEQTDITIVHPWDPWKQGIGGFESCMDGFLRYAPLHWNIGVVGITKDQHQRPIGIWQTRSFADRPVKFLAVMEDSESDRVRPVPLSLRFVLACFKFQVKLQAPIIQFHRFESALGLTIPEHSRQVYFLHNHPNEIRSAFSDVRWHWLAPLHDRLLLHQLFKASAVVSVDPRTPAWVKSNLSNSQMDLIFQNQWADPSIFFISDEESQNRDRLSLRTYLGATPNDKVVLFAGRLEIQKDPILLINAFASLYKYRQDAWLVIVGNGRLEGLIKAKIKDLGITERVKFIGTLTRQEMATIYRSADVLVCTSGFEAGPRNVFEALACGTPVISPNVGQVSSISLDQNEIGRLIRSREPDDFTQALRQVLEWPPSASLHRRCAKAVDKFTPQQGLAPIFDLYEQWLKT